MSASRTGDGSKGYLAHKWAPAGPLPSDHPYKYLSRPSIGRTISTGGFRSPAPRLASWARRVPWRGRSWSRAASRVSETALEGTLAGAVAISGQASGAQAQTGALAGALSIQASLVGETALEGTLAGAVAISGSVSAVHAQLGTLAATVALVGAWSGEHQLEGGLAGTVTVAASLAGETALEGELAGTVATVVVVAGEVGFAGDVAGLVLPEAAATGEHEALLTEDVFVRAVPAAGVLGQAVDGPSAGLVGAVEVRGFLEGLVEAQGLLGGSRRRPRYLRRHGGGHRADRPARGRGCRPGRQLHGEHALEGALVGAVQPTAELLAAHGAPAELQGRASPASLPKLLAPRARRVLSQPPARRRPPG